MDERGDWIRVMPASELLEGRAVRTSLGDQDLLLYRRGDDVYALSDRCTHQGAPLHRGRVSGTGATLSVTCPAHGSMFRLVDGRVLRGPAMRPVAAYEARVSDGGVEVRPRSSDPAPEADQP